ncbi:hypothetical protein ACXET9_07290 [Brachybacterium sp. DNPG3]
MATKLTDAYDTRTGAKLPQRVPEVWLRIFPFLSKTPKAKASAQATTSTTEKKEA